MANKPQDKPLSQMTDEERRAELERLKAEVAKGGGARFKQLEITGFFEWAQRFPTRDIGDVWLAGYAKALLDEKENNDPKE